MKDKFKSWQNLKYEPRLVAQSSITIKIREILRFQELENDLVCDWVATGHHARSVRKIDELSKQVFGITEAETDFIFPENYSSLIEGSHEKNTINNAFRKHEESYSTAKVSDEEAVKILLELRIDFRDINGHPLRLTRFFKKQAEAASKGIKGKFPDVRSLNDGRWEDQMQIAADKFKKTRPNIK